MPHSRYSQLPETRTIHDMEALRGYFEPMRQRIIAAIGDQPITVQELAEKLDVPFTRLYYHIHFLEKHGFIEQVDSLSFGGAVEQKYYYTTAKFFVIDRKLLTVHKDDEDDGLEVVLDSVLDATHHDIRASARAGVIDLQQRSPHPQAMLIVRGFFKLTPERVMEFQQRIVALMQAMEDPAHSDDTGQYYGFAVALYPSTHVESQTGGEEEEG